MVTARHVGLSPSTKAWLLTVTMITFLFHSSYSRADTAFSEPSAYDTGVLFIYSPLALEQAGSLESLSLSVNIQVFMLNLIMNNSGLRRLPVFINTGLLSSNDVDVTDTHDDLLTHITSNSALHEEQVHRGADLVIYIDGDQPSPGTQACTGTTYLQAGTQQGYVVVERRCLADLTGVAGNLGYLYGASSTQMTAPYGHCNHDGGFRTVMMPKDQCNHEAILHFSNPAVSIDKEGQSYATGVEDESNMADVIDRRARSVSQIAEARWGASAPVPAPNGCVYHPGQLSYASAFVLALMCLAFLRYRYIRTSHNSHLQVSGS